MSVRTICPVIRLAVACLMVAIGLRTWLIMGLIEPVTVSGSSMVPALSGSFVQPRCPACEHLFAVGTEFAERATAVRCPHCSHATVSLEGLTIHRGDRLWIDRAAFSRQSPRRWDLVVVRNPENVAELSVKRIVGLPGEQVELDDGDVLIDGAVIPKPCSQQLMMRQLLFEVGDAPARWSGNPGSGWRFDQGTWTHRRKEANAIDWLRYRHPESTITDDVTYNAGITRKLNLVDEFLLSTSVRATGRGSLHFEIYDGTTRGRVSLYLPVGRIEASVGGQHSGSTRLPPQAVRQLSGSGLPISLSNTDGQLLLVVQGRSVFRSRWPRHPAVGVQQPVRIGIRNTSAEISQLALYRDLYYGDHAVGTAVERPVAWSLGASEYFLLGDNSPVSLDSRVWGPVSQRLVVGRSLCFANASGDR